jgi:hypothetical protein
MRECASRAAGAYPRARAYMSQPILYLDPSAPDVTCALHARPINIASLVSTSRDQVSWDRFLAERLTRLKPVQTLNQHIPAPILSSEDWCGQALVRNSPGDRCNY